MALADVVRGIVNRYGAPCSVYPLAGETAVAETRGYLSVLGRQDRRYGSEDLSPAGLGDSRRYLLITPPLAALGRLTGAYRVQIHGEWYHPLVSEPIRLGRETVYLRTTLEPYHEGAAAWTS